MIDVLAGQWHYLPHLTPVYARLPATLRGEVITPEVRLGRNGADVALVASSGDVRRAFRAGYSKVARMQHGVGQTYGKPPKDDGSGLFLCPNEYSASVYRQAFPGAVVRVTGCPRVEELPAIISSGGARVVAVSFHWNNSQNPETRSGFPQYKDAVLALREHYTVIGHAHPRVARILSAWYRKHGIPYFEDFDDICRNADVYVCDNSSTIYEFAATGRPVVVLNTWYMRTSKGLGGRFWEWSTVGVQVDRPLELVEAVRLALLDPPGIRKERERIVSLAYQPLHGATQATVDALMEWVA